MALKAGYYGLKRSLLNKVKALPGIKSIGTGLSLNSTTGELEATGATISIEANPEAAATENLIKLGLGENVYAVPDAAKTYQTDDATETAIVDADYIPFFDKSAASGDGAPKKSTWTNFIAKIKAKITEFVPWEANSILGAKNRAYSQINNSAIASIVSGLSYKVSWEGIATVTLKKNDASGATIISGSTSPLEFTADDNYSLYFGSSVDVTNIMVYDAADTDPNFVPYAMTNRELTENKADNSVISAYVENGTTASKAYGIGEHFIRKGLLGVAVQAIASGGTFTLNTNYREGNLSGLLTPVIISNAIDLDTLVASGIYYIIATPTHGPEDISSFILLNFYISSSTQIQVAIRGSGENIYVRTKTSGTWHEWYKFTGTALS